MLNHRMRQAHNRQEPKSRSSPAGANADADGAAADVEIIQTMESHRQRRMVLQ